MSSADEPPEGMTQEMYDGMLRLAMKTAARTGLRHVVVHKKNDCYAKNTMGAPCDCEVLILEPGGNS